MSERTTEMEAKKQAISLDSIRATILETTSCLNYVKNQLDFIINGPNKESPLPGGDSKEMGTPNLPQMQDLSNILRNKANACERLVKQLS